MVSAAFAHSPEQGKKRWMTYLALSVCANVALLSAIELEQKVDMVLEIPVIRVNLMSMARPAPKAPEIVKAEIAPAAATPTYVAPVETTATAPQSIAPRAEKVTETMPAPAVEAAPVPKPALRPVTQTAAKPKPDPEPAAEMVRMEVAEPQPTAETPPVVSEPVVAEAMGDADSTVIYEATYRLQTPPVYPRRALELGQQGVVTLHAEVLPNGDPRDLKVAKSSGYRLLDMAALAAVKKWKFEPRNVDGNAVASWVRVPVNFVIQ